MLKMVCSVNSMKSESKSPKRCHDVCLWDGPSVWIYASRIILLIIKWHFSNFSEYCIIFSLNICISPAAYVYWINILVPLFHLHVNKRFTVCWFFFWHSTHRNTICTIMMVSRENCYKRASNAGSSEGFKLNKVQINDFQCRLIDIPQMHSQKRPNCVWMSPPALRYRVLLYIQNVSSLSNCI